MKSIFMIIVVIFTICSAGFAEEDKKADFVSNAINRNEGLHFEILANASVFSLHTEENKYLGYLITPEARFRYGINKKHSLFVAFGYDQIAQFKGGSPCH